MAHEESEDVIQTAGNSVNPRPSPNRGHSDKGTTSLHKLQGRGQLPTGVKMAGP